MRIFSYKDGQGNKYGFIRDNLLYPLQVENFSELLVGIHNLKEHTAPVPLSFSEIIPAPINLHPSKIIGIGLNYAEHASDLDVSRPDEFPVIFFKTPNTVIGAGDTIRIPKESKRTTGEAELGIVIAKECHAINPDTWKDYVAGFVPILDMTAEDILRKNNRYLQLSKVFDTFISIGSELITLDEFHNIDEIRVETVLNNEVVGGNVVANMRFPPGAIIAFLSRLFPLMPGDIISTGTPRAGILSHGDRLECRISNFLPLVNTVMDTKISSR